MSSVNPITLCRPKQTLSAETACVAKLRQALSDSPELAVKNELARTKFLTRTWRKLESQWNKAIGNRIVHNYMNINMDVVFDLVREARYRFIAAFPIRPISLTGDI